MTKHIYRQIPENIHKHVKNTTVDAKQRNLLEFFKRKKFYLSPTQDSCPGYTTFTREYSGKGTFALGLYTLSTIKSYESLDEGHFRKS